MAYTSAQFSEQAGTDLELAQEIAAGHASGEALGTAASLGQQCMELQMKATILGMDEAMGIARGEEFCKRNLGHSIYARPDRFYLESLALIGLAADRGDARTIDPACYGFYGDPAEDLDFLRGLGKTWGKRLYSRDIRGLLLQYRLGVILTEDERGRLNSRLDGIAEVSGEPCAPSNLYSNQRPDYPTYGTMLDARRLRRCREHYARTHSRPYEAFGVECFFGQSVRGAGRALAMHHDGRITRDAARKIARLGALRYCALALSAFTAQYAYMYPNASFGRYPCALPNGSSSADAYAGRRRAVLAMLLVDTHHYHGQIRQVGERLGELCAMCPARC